MKQVTYAGRTHIAVRSAGIAYDAGVGLTDKTQFIYIIQVIVVRRAAPASTRRHRLGRVTTPWPRGRAVKLGRRHLDTHGAMQTQWMRTRKHDGTSKKPPTNGTL